jgi:hypothetical protein
VSAFHRKLSSAVFTLKLWLVCGSILILAAIILQAFALSTPSQSGDVSSSGSLPAVTPCIALCAG